MEPINKLLVTYRTLKNKKTVEYSEAEKILMNFVSQIHNFYKAYDLHESTNHSKVFELLFLEKRQRSCESIAQNTNIAVRTLSRFKAQYLSFMSKVLQSDAVGNEIGQNLSDFIK